MTRDRWEICKNRSHIAIKRPLCVLVSIKFFLRKQRGEKEAPETIGVNLCLLCGLDGPFRRKIKKRLSRLDPERFDFFYTSGSTDLLEENIWCLCKRKDLNFFFFMFKKHFKRVDIQSDSVPRSTRCSLHWFLVCVSSRRSVSFPAAALAVAHARTNWLVRSHRGYYWLRCSQQANRCEKDLGQWTRFMWVTRKWLVLRQCFSLSLALSSHISGTSNRDKDGVDGRERETSTSSSNTNNREGVEPYFQQSGAFAWQKWPTFDWRGNKLVNCRIVGKQKSFLRTWQQVSPHFSLTSCTAAVQLGRV